MSKQHEYTSLNEQVLSVCDKAHNLLGSPIKLLEGEIDTEKVVLEISTGLTYLSGYLSMLSQNTGQPVPCWGHHEQALARKHKGQRAVLRHYLEQIITNTLHEELHLLSTLTHPFLETTKERNYGT